MFNTVTSPLIIAIQEWLKSNPTASYADIAKAAQDAGITHQQMSTATGLPVEKIVELGATVGWIPPVNQLSGVILAGASWLAGDEKTKLAQQAFGTNVTNTAIGGQKTSDVLNQLNTFEKNGGTFAPGSTVVLDVGANDIAQGVDKVTITKNLNEIISNLNSKDVKVILSGQPDANSYQDATSRTDLKMDDLYKEVAKNNPNVTLVDAMAGFLNQKELMDESGFHLKDDASKAIYINKFAEAYIHNIEVIGQVTIDGLIPTIG